MSELYHCGMWIGWMKRVVNSKWWIPQAIIMVTGAPMTPPLQSETINQLLGPTTHHSTHNP